MNLALSRLCRFGLVLALGLSLLGGCASKKSARPERWAGPLVSMQETPEAFVSKLAPENLDLDGWTDLGPTVRKSLTYVSKKPRGGIAVSRPGLRLTWGEMRDTLQLLHDLLPRLDKEPGLFLERFRWVPVRGGIKYSGYYEPRVPASRTPKPGYIPIYKCPPDLASYRASHGSYYSRKEIDGDGVLAGRGLELAWADPVDIYFLQIQGSGKLVYDDGTEAYVNYAGQNGRKYRASGRIMREHGAKLKRYDILEQREWFKAHPDRMYEIMFDNPSYVFFKFGMRGSVGSMGYVVDDWLSLATDVGFLPLGSVIAYGVDAPDPKMGRFPLRGIGFAQDTGGAIKRNRIDIYCGGSDRANYVASNLDASGPAWVLVSADAVPPSFGNEPELAPAPRALAVSSSAPASRASAASASKPSGKELARASKKDTPRTAKPAAKPASRQGQKAGKPAAKPSGKPQPKKAQSQPKKTQQPARAKPRAK